MKALWLVAASALALTACNKGADSTTNTTVPMDETAVTDNAGMTDNGMADGNAMAAAPMAAQDFANAAASTDAFEIAEAKLAETKATDPKVKDFAKQMITDHTASTAKIKAAAGTIKPDPTLSAEQQTNLDALKAANAADFDTTYKTQQIAAHQKALGVMQGYAATGDNDALKTAAGEIAPTVQKHLTMLNGM